MQIKGENRKYIKDNIVKPNKNGSRESLECSRGVLTKVGVTSKTYGLKRVDPFMYDPHKLGHTG